MNSIIQIDPADLERCDTREALARQLMNGIAGPHAYDFAMWFCQREMGLAVLRGSQRDDPDLQGKLDALYAGVPIATALRRPTRKRAAPAPKGLDPELLDSLGLL